MPATDSTNSTRTSLLAVFALLLLTASQLAFAGHQFEHVAGDVFEVCGVCLQLESSDDLLSGDIEEFHLIVAPRVIPVFKEAAAACTRIQARQPRGPPAP